MKCMAVPANLTKDRWWDLVVRECKRRDYAEWFYADREAWLELFDEGMTVNEAISYQVECLY